MKKLIFALVAGFIPALVTTTGAYAQHSNYNIKFEEEIIGLENPHPPLEDNAGNLSGISTKAIKDFSRSYKNVNGEKWSINADGYTASFIFNDITNVVYYTKKGRWAGSLKGYSENKMPADVRATVRATYYDFAITYVQEIETSNTAGKAVYVVHLEDANNIILARVIDGAMDVWQRYNK